MGLAKEKKGELVEAFGRAGTDTGSVEVQIALLTERIRMLTDHARRHSKDHHSRRGLLKLVGQRRRFLRYMQRRDLTGYRALIGKLEIRG
ncbi:MAG: 30S ribosomal protein S15 [Candidatus Latescibacteria bacterium]|nr:30S ribosomal protein S15 [Candidatus Latescibacterota bacterium]